MMGWKLLTAVTATVGSMVLTVAIGGPASADAVPLAPPPTRVVFVAAGEEPWVGTGIHVRAGDTVDVTATGAAITYLTFARFSRSGPDGQSAPCVNRAPDQPDTDCALNGAPYGALVGRIGSSTFLLGSRARMHAREAGELQLAVNDNTGSYTDNTGGYAVRVHTGPPAQSGLLAYQWAGAPNGTDGVWMARADGTDPHSVQPTEPALGFHPDWSPDGHRIAFADQDQGIWAMAPDGSDAELVQACLSCDFPAWSPDGSRIAYTQYTLGPNDGPPESSTVVVLDLATGSRNDVVSAKQPQLVDVPRWAPDGKRLVYGIDLFDADFNEAGSAIAVVALNGGKPKILTDFSTYAYYPDWNRFTDQIVFSTETMAYTSSPPPGSETWNLYTIAPDGTRLRSLTNVPTGWRLWQPTWTPDGTRITATLDQPGSRAAVYVDGDGTVSATLTPATHTRMQPTS